MQWGAVENRVVNSHVSITLQAVILPAKRLYIFKDTTRDESLSCFLSITFSLSTLVISFSLYPHFSPLSNLPTAMLSFPYRFLFFVPFLSSLLTVCCCCGSALSGSGSAEKLTKTTLPGFAGRYPARGCEVAIQTATSTSTAERWRDRWKEGCWEQRGAGKEGRYVHLVIKARKIWCASHCT